MERFIADLVAKFESGAIDRREFCKTIALAAVVYGAGESAKAQPARGFKVLGINHVSYACPDYAKARDWYASIFGMEVAPGKDTGSRANLMFGPEAGKGGSYLVPSNAAANARPPARAVIDHICFTIPNWDETRIRSALKTRNADVGGGRPGSFHVFDPFDYDIQIGNAVEENAFRR